MKHLKSLSNVAVDGVVEVGEKHEKSEDNVWFYVLAVAAMDLQWNKKLSAICREICSEKSSQKPKFESIENGVKCFKPRCRVWIRRDLSKHEACRNETKPL